jgi:hypothetical protein
MRRSTALSLPFRKGPRARRFWTNKLDRFTMANISTIRKDCYQVKSNLLTVDNLVFHIQL